MNKRILKTSEQGFILATSLVMLVLLTMLSIATYYGTVISQQTSASAQESTQSFYYAETGLNYVAWALRNDAEFDAYSYVPTSPIYEPIARQDRYGAVTLNAFAVGDRREWEASKGHPSSLQAITPFFQSGQKAAVYGQLSYFDNRDLSARPVILLGSSAGSDTYAFGTAASPVFHDIYTQISGYIRLDIDAYGQITPSFSPYAQHANNSHLCNGQTVGDIPCNGAIVWLTAGDPYTDRVLYPIDPSVAAPLRDAYASNFSFTGGQGLPISTACVSNSASCNTLLPSSPNYDVYSNGLPEQMPNTFKPYYQQLPCDLSLFNSTHITCEQPIDPATGKPTGGTGRWLKGNEYGLVVYAIGYSGGKARKMIRMVLL